MAQVTIQATSSTHHFFCAKAGSSTVHQDIEQRKAAITLIWRVEKTQERGAPFPLDEYFGLGSEISEGFLLNDLHDQIRSGNGYRSSHGSSVDLLVKLLAEGEVRVA